MMNKTGRNVDPSGTPRTMSSQLLKKESIFTRYLLLNK